MFWSMLWAYSSSFFFLILLFVVSSFFRITAARSWSGLKLQEKRYGNSTFCTYKIYASLVGWKCNSFFKWNLQDIYCFSQSQLLWLGVGLHLIFILASFSFFVFISISCAKQVFMYANKHHDHKTFVLAILVSVQVLLLFVQFRLSFVFCGTWDCPL